MPTTTTPLDELARRAETYAKEIHRRFFRVLTREDCADVVQDVFLLAAESETCRHFNRYKLEAWIRHAAQHRALDIVKDPHHLGQGKRRRTPRLDITDLAEVLAAETPDETDDTHMKALLAAFARLPARQQQILGLRHLDNLTREACARVMNMSVMTFRRSHDDAVRRLIDLVVQTRPHDTCAEARALIHLSADGHLEPESIARLDAHLEGCAHCHHYRRRSRGLLVFLPLPALTLADRLAARLHVVVDRLMPAAQGADPSLAAGGGGAAALGGAKIVAVLAAGAVAVGGPIAAHHLSGRDTAHAAVRGPGVPVAGSSPAATSSDGSRTYTYAARPSSQVSAPTPSTRRSGGVAANATRHKTRTSTLGELKPAGHEVSPTAARPATLPAPQGAATSSRAPTKTTNKAAPAPVPGAPTADSSSGEFAPHP
jgi:RNA polymerase sigma factor (sigma-70 family)